MASTSTAGHVGISYSAAGWDPDDWQPQDDDELLKEVRLRCEQGVEVGVTALENAPLLQGLFGECFDVFATLVLPALSPTELALFARASRACQAAVVKSGLPRAGTINVCESAQYRDVFRLQPNPLDVRNFVESAAMLKWAKVGSVQTV
jgi:hypothetical protein